MEAIGSCERYCGSKARTGMTLCGVTAIALGALLFIPRVAAWIPKVSATRAILLAVGGAAVVASRLIRTAKKEPEILAFLLQDNESVRVGLDQLVQGFLTIDRIDRCVRVEDYIPVPIEELYENIDGRYYHPSKGRFVFHLGVTSAKGTDLRATLQVTAVGLQNDPSKGHATQVVVTVEDQRLWLTKQQAEPILAHLNHLIKDVPFDKLEECPGLRVLKGL